MSKVLLELVDESSYLDYLSYVFYVGIVVLGVSAFCAIGCLNRRVNSCVKQSVRKLELADVELGKAQQNIRDLEKDRECTRMLVNQARELSESVRERFDLIRENEILTREVQDVLLDNEARRMEKNDRRLEQAHLENLELGGPGSRLYLDRTQERGKEVEESEIKERKQERGKIGVWFDGLRSRIRGKESTDGGEIDELGLEKEMYRDAFGY